MEDTDYLPLCAVCKNDIPLRQLRYKDNVAMCKFCWQDPVCHYYMFSHYYKVHKKEGEAAAHGIPGQATLRYDWQGEEGLPADPLSD